MGKLTDEMKQEILKLPHLSSEAIEAVCLINDHCPDGVRICTGRHVECWQEAIRKDGEK